MMATPPVDPLATSPPPDPLSAWHACLQEGARHLPSPHPSSVLARPGLCGSAAQHHATQKRLATGGRKRRGHPLRLPAPARGAPCGRPTNSARLSPPPGSPPSALPRPGWEGTKRAACRKAAPRPGGQPRGGVPECPALRGACGSGWKNRSRRRCWQWRARQSCAWRGVSARGRRWWRVWPRGPGSG